LKIAVGTDNDFSVSEDRACADAFIKKVEAAGHTCVYVGRGPNVVQHYAQRNQIDIMVQIAAGKCIGTFADFVNGCKGTGYKASKFSIPYWKNEESVMTWKAHRAGDDNFSWNMDLSAYLGKTLPQVYKENSDVAIFSHGNTGEEMATMFLQGLGGGSADTTFNGGGGGGQSALDLIKQVITPWDKFGVTLELWDNQLFVGRAKTANAEIITEDMIINDSITMTDYLNTTPNYATDGTHTVQNDKLIERFGKIPVPETIENKGKTWLQDMYQVAQRGCNHCIDFKIPYVSDPGIGENQYIYLKIPTLGVDGYYWVMKKSVEDDYTMSLSCEPAPPSRYQEQTENVNVNVNNSNSLGKDPISIGNALAAKYKFASQIAADPGEHYKGCEDYECMKKNGNGSCYAWSDALYTELNAAGIKARIIQYNSGMASNHRSVQINTNGSWEDYPYRSTNISKYARNTTNKPGMFIYKKEP
jgi:hypothetical protein